MHQRAALLAGEDRLVNGRSQRLTAENQARARSAQRLVGSGCGYLRVGHGRRVYAARHQPGDVRHVEDVHRAYFVGYLPHAGEVPQPRISAAAADDGLGPLALGCSFQVVVVD